MRYIAVEIVNVSIETEDGVQAYTAVSPAEPLPHDSKRNVLDMQNNRYICYADDDVIEDKQPQSSP